MTLEQMPHSFSRWAIQGKTPFVRFKQKNSDSMVFFGGLSFKNKKQIAHLGKNHDSKNFILWLEELVKTYRQDIDLRLSDHLKKLAEINKNKKEEDKIYEGLILAVVDGASCHTSHEVREWLIKHYGEVELFRFPTYSPNLNPQEKVWKALRKFLSDVRDKYSFKQLTDRACRFLLTKVFDYKFV